MTEQRGDHLLELLLRGADDFTANELLNEILAGYNISNIVPLIYSDNPTAVDAGAWIISELGVGALPLLNDVDFLLSYPSRKARFFAVEAVLTSATEAHGAIVANAISLVCDQDEAVRWKVIQLLARASSDQLKAAVPHLQASKLRMLVQTLITLEGTADTEEAVSAALDDPDCLVRLVALASAVRMAGSTLAPLEHAATSSDSEVRAFAGDELESFRRRRGRPRSHDL